MAGQTFVVAPCSVVGQAAQDVFCDTEQKRQLLVQGGGCTRIHGPEGSELAEPLAEDQEGIPYADLDFALIAIAQPAADPVGHYSRPDVFQLLVNPRPNRVVVGGERRAQRPPVEVTEPSDPTEDVLVRAVVSRVGSAAVTVDGEVVGQIGRGLLALVGVGREDDTGRARTLARKVHELRVFPAEDGARSAGDLGLPVLVVSQFTLYADTRKGRRPSWADAAPGEVAEPLVAEVVAELRRRGSEVATGVFGAPMQVSSVNEGPMTLLLEV